VALVTVVDIEDMGVIAERVELSHIARPRTASSA
jgi:hypothetical protein